MNGKHALSFVSKRTNVGEPNGDITSANKIEPGGDVKAHTTVKV